MVLIVAALSYMGAARLHEWWHLYRAEHEAAAQQAAAEFSFQQVPLSLAAPQAEPVEPPVKYQPQLPPIYLEDTPLSSQTQQQQAQQTLASIVEDFDQTADMQSFNLALQQASNGEVNNLADLSSQDLGQLIQKNPDIRLVIKQHLNNKEFAAKIDEIFSNPQFQQSVKQLQE